MSDQLSDHPSRENDGGPIIETSPPVASVDPVGPAALASLLADAARAVPGVIRLEPTLGGQIRRWSQDPTSMIASGAPELPDGVLTRDRTGGVEVRIDIAVRPARPADEIAAEVRDAVAEMITKAGRIPGTIMVSVLAVEPG